MVSIALAGIADAGLVIIEDEPDHYVTFDEDGWLIEHSVACRVAGTIGTCAYNATIREIADEPWPDQFGRWRITEIDSEGLPSLTRAPAGLKDLLATHIDPPFLTRWKDASMIDITKPWQVIEMTAQQFLLDMAALGKYQDINLVGAYADPDDQTARTAHRDKDLPWHRDGIESQAIKDMQGGKYITKPDVDVVGMFCLRDNRWGFDGGEHIPCRTILAEAAPDADPYDDSQFTILTEVDLQPGQALVWDNRLWHRRQGPVGSRVLVRFWSTCPEIRDLPLPR